MPLVLKLELMQHTGSFKTRGAFSNLLTRAVPAAGVVAASGGNHGVAVAYAAKKAGKAGAIFVPVVSSPAKMDRIRSYGAELVVGGERYNDALIASQEWAERVRGHAGACVRPDGDAVGRGYHRPGVCGTGSGRWTHCWWPAAAAD